ncbi:RPM1-interacting protein 4 (RIN4) family protein [Medicago truncatula]|uniref:RPM1-interacting protein 4 (RIN4) family protein n=1 Tax=Medicago truncatula TaxID=3880 RepID=A0A072TVK2_MEDTR|nr:RPM1-interacting protein 4 (RIN4) family protein [Medicago truncatula]
MPMDARKENGGWLSVPQFGDWDQKGQVPDYSLDFSKIRETRKQNKTNISRASLGNDEEFNIDSTSSSTSNTVSSIEQQQQQHTPRYHHQTHSPTTRKSFLSYFNCCVKS